METEKGQDYKDYCPCKGVVEAECKGAQLQRLLPLNKKRVVEAEKVHDYRDYCP